jgi:hypothetical protein
MSGYRLYILSDTGRLVGAVETALERGPQAIEWAKQLLDGKDMELWIGARLVAKFQYRTRQKVSP